MSAARFIGKGRFLALAAALSLASAWGCNTTEIETKGSGPMAFAPDADAQPDGNGSGSGASIVLRSRPLVITPRDHVVVDVVARGAADLHGAAFRLTWDSDSLSFADAQNGPGWSKQVIALAKEGAPGQLAVVWTEKGETSVDATHETVLGTLTFAVKSRKTTALSFMQERAQVVDKLGAPVAVKWHGGAVAAR